MGKNPLDQVVKDYDVEVEWKAFELRPEGVDIPAHTPEYMERAKAGVESMSKQYGIEMNWNDKSKHSRHALEGAKFADSQGKSNDYHEAVFRAQFQQEKAINDIDTLVGIAEAIGLDPVAFREALESRKHEPEVLDDIQEASQIGITGIPCFISGNKGVMGAQSYEDLVELIKND
ncbi:DsbA family oxidoreductase [Virgibacillus sp. DJP39]|uniref:DsbA family oxidoreductase n=1 Tax=Virgibacillus sp. DJP39 TaxID=3409790 RepID=UPI003BB539A0